MPSMPVEVLPIAREDVNQALLYIAADDPLAAERLLDRILQALQQAGEQPESGTVVVIGKKIPRVYRRLYVAPYCIYYRVFNDRIVVMRVLHERMDAKRYV